MAAPWRISGLVRGQRGDIDHGRAAASRRGLDRAADAHARGPDRQAAARGIRHLFDWLVTGQVVPMNPAASVRGPSHIVKAGKTPVLEPEEARALIDSIESRRRPACATGR